MSAEHTHEAITKTVRIKWDLRMRFLAAFIWVMCVGIMENTDIILLAGVVAVGTLLLLGVTAKRLIKRVFIIAPFILISFLTLMISDGVPITEEAFEFAFLILCRLLVSVIVITMVSVDDIKLYLDCFNSMRFPDSLTSTLFLAQRYVHLINKELISLQNALRSRLFKAKFGMQSMKVYGQITGGMTVKAIDRSEYIKQAMMSRGFDGKVRTGQAPKIDIIDFIKSLAAIVVITVLVVIDRGFLI
jgi:cobalt/nickel transport system permease protein